MTDSITFKYTLTEEDAVRVVRFENTYSKFFWAMVLVVALMFAYSLFVNAVLALDGQRSWYAPLKTLTIFGALFGAWGAFNWYLPVSIAKRWPGVGMERQITANADGMAVQDSLGYTASIWENYTDILETNHFFLLRSGPANTLAIPKKTLTAVSGLSDFREFLRRRATVYRRV